MEQSVHKSLCEFIPSNMREIITENFPTLMRRNHSLFTPYTKYVHNILLLDMYRVKSTKEG